MKTNKKCGFSMIELMIAIAIISISMVSLISVILTNMRLDQMTKEMNLASEAASNEMSRVQGLTYGGGAIPGDIKTLILANDPHTEDFPVAGLAKWNDPNMNSAGTNDVGYTEITSDAANNNLVRIVVRINWMASNGEPMQVQVVSKKSDRGANWTP